MTSTPTRPPAPRRSAEPAHRATHRAARRPERGTDRSSEPGASTAARRTLLALLGCALGALPLNGLFTDRGWLIDAWLSMIIVAAPAALLRLRRPPGALDVWPGVVLLIPWLTARFVPDHALLGIIPTGGTWNDVSLLMTSLHHTTRDEVAPVQSTPAVRLVVCALLGLLAALVDLIAVVGHRAALAGVPLLAVYTVAGAVPRNPVDWVWFACAAVGYLVLLGIDAADELQHWGRRIPRRGGSAAARSALGVSAPRVGLIAIVVGLVVPLAVPDHPRNIIADAFHHSGGGSGSGNGIGLGGTSISPFANLKGQLTRPKPVNLMTVKISNAAASTAPQYLRSNVLDEYTGSGWRAGNGNASDELDDADGSTFATDPPSTQPDTNRFVARITISGLGGAPPVFALPLRLGGLDSGTKWSQQNQVLVGSRVRSGQTITEAVNQPAPTQADLDLSIGDIPADMSHWLQLPALPSYVTDLVSRLTKGKATPYARARALNDYFTQPKNGFVYNLKTKPGDSGSELVDFLKNKTGFCQQYAAAMAVMLRQSGVPARVVLGYMHPDPDVGGSFTVTTSDAHAWVEGYFKNIGWLPFDPTPSAGLSGGPRSDQSYAPHVFPSSGNDAIRKSRGAAASSSAAAQASSSAASTSATAAAGGSGSDDRTPLWIAIGLLVVASLALTPGGARALRRRRRMVAARGGDPDPLWAELSDTAIDLGYVWSPARSPRQVASWLGRDTSEPQALTALANAVEQRRYSPAAAPDTDPGALADGLRRVTASLRARRSGSVRLRSRLWPASLRWWGGGVRMGGKRHR